jgi:hypothetical protein
MDTIILSVFKTLLQKSRESETNQLILSTLKEITAWGGGGRRHHYSEHNENRKKETEQLLADPVKYWTSKIKNDEDVTDDEVDDAEDEGTDDEDVEEKETKRQIAPENMQEGLKKVATTHRSPIQREDAIKRLPDDFLIEQVKNPKQHTRVRLLAIEILIKAKSKSIDTFAQDDSLPTELKEAAIEGTQDKKILLKAAQDGYVKALYKLDLKDILKFPKETVEDAFKGGSWNRNINWKDKLKEATPAQRKEFATMYADEFSDNNFFEALAPYIKEIKDNKDLLLKVFTKMPHYNDYYHAIRADILFKLKDDKEFLKRFIFDSEKTDRDELTLLALALYGGKNKEFYTKLAQTKEFKDFEHTEQDFIMLQIDDQEVLKKIISNKDSGYVYFNEKVLEKIKDQKFLKALFVKQGKQYILEVVDDDDFKKKLYEEKNDYGYLRYIKDEEYLKKIYNKSIIDTKDRELKEKTADIRKAAMTNIKDIDFLQKVAKKDSSYEVRLAAIKNIDDPAILEALVLRESSKTAKMNMLNAIDNQDVLMAFRRKEKDTEIQGKIDSRLSKESILTLIQEGIRVNPYAVGKIKRETLKPIIIKSSGLVDEYRHLFLKDEKFLLEILKKYPDKAPDVVNHIKDQKTLLKLFKEGFAKDIGYEGIKNLTDPKLLRTYLIENGTQNVLDVFEKLNPSQDELLDIIKNTNSGKVKSEGTKLLLTDPDVLKKVLLKAPCNMDMFRNSWSQIKDDKDFLAKFVMIQTDLEIIEKVLPKISDNEDVMKELLGVALKNKSSYGWAGDKYIDELIKNTNDKEYIAKLILEQEDHHIIVQMAAKISDKIDVIEALIVKIFRGADDGDSYETNTFDKLFPYVKHDTKFLEKFVATQADPHIIDKIVPEVSDNKKLLRELLKNVGPLKGWKADELFAKLVNIIDDVNYVKSILFSLNEKRFKNVVDETLTRSPKEIENILLHTDSSDFQKIEYLVNTLKPDYAGDMQLFKKTNNNTVKQAIVIWIKPDLFTKDMVDEFIAGLQQTERPYEIHPDLKAKAYEWGTDSQQDALKGFVDESLWNQRHREAMDRPYTNPDRRGGVKHKPIEHDVEKNPNYQMFRLLVSLAR